MHYIQKYILRILTYTKWARFRDMRPPRVDSNAYSYHLRALQKDKLVEKTEKGYRLSPQGLAYVDKVSLEKFEPRIQPKLTNMLVIRNDKNEVLLITKAKQPFIGSWMLPYGKLHLEDESIYSAAVREADEKLNFRPEGLEHKGSCYIRAYVDGELVSSILANVFTTTLSEAKLGENARWAGSDERSSLKLAPATEEVIQLVDNSKSLFFEQLDIHW